MTPHREAILAKVRQWVEYAEEDLRLVEHTLTLGEACPHRLVAYHCQQVAEKYLKALLVYREIDFPFTHHLSFLLELCEDELPSMKHENLDRLTRYAVSARYPGTDYPVSKKDAELALRTAKAVRSTVAALIHDVLETP